MAIGLGVMVAVACTPAAAQPRALAVLFPVEAGRWTLTEGELSGGLRAGEVCSTGRSLYVAAVRVEPGYRGSFVVSAPGPIIRAGGNDVVVRVGIEPYDGDRETWEAFVVESDRECFNIRAGMRNAAASVGRPGQVGLRAELYQVRIGVDW
ncbi:MAG: hypothetical protein OXH52_17070 [Gammaproteobacteria bacterium]|nr:hypothetical protein [Gammaproteobacteria bacterium]